jgi:hypothetical protein
MGPHVYLIRRGDDPVGRGREDMKKLMTMLLGAGLALGTVSAFGQVTNPSASTDTAKPAKKPAKTKVAKPAKVKTPKAKATKNTEAAPKQ